MTIIGENSDHENFVNVVAIDSGSGSIKLATAFINSTSHELLEMHKHSLDLKLSKDIEEQLSIKEIEDSGLIHNLYDSYFPLDLCAFFKYDENQNLALFKENSDEAQKFLHEVYANKFSEKIKSIYINNIYSYIESAKKANPDYPTEVWLVGTAALRKAGDGDFLIEELSKKLQEELDVTTKFRIISQKEEGIYAFEGGVDFLGLDADKTISWDIGGGSMQITGKNNSGDFQVLGGVVASSTFAPMVLDLIGKKDADTIYPITSDQIKDSIYLGKEKISFSIDQEEWFFDKADEDGVSIIGVGNIHASILYIMQLNNIIGKDITEYTYQNMMDLLSIFADKDLESVKSMILESNHSYIENIVTNMILVTATMEKYGINRVKVADVSNVNTLIYRACYRMTI